MATKQADSKITSTFTLGLFGALCMAIVIHALLLLLLSMEMRWTRDASPITMEAELWSTLPVDIDVQRTEALAPQNAIVPPPDQQVIPRIVVEQDIDPSEKAEQLLQDQQEQKRRKKDAYKLRSLEAEQESRDETVRDPT